MRKDNYLEWWTATYRTHKPETKVKPYLWSYQAMKDYQSGRMGHLS